jgi:nitroimidazol reductase NimA-like FMN-containing flavoprotein (pyridoxamine 5'-phosphate oxidase superfamily)
VPRPLTVQERQEFLADLHVAVLSVASDSDRPPLTIPVWYSYQPGGNLTFFTGSQGRKTRKTRLIQKAGVLSLSVQRDALPYKYVTVEGTVVQTDRPPAAEQLFAIVRRYMPEEMARGFVEAEIGRADSELVLYTIRPDRWLTFDFSEDAG